MKVPIGWLREFVDFTAEVPRLAEPRIYDPPPFGSFVKIGKPAPITPSAPTPVLDLEEEHDPFATPSAIPPAGSKAMIDLPPAVYALVVGATTFHVALSKMLLSTARKLIGVPPK